MTAPVVWRLAETDPAQLQGSLPSPSDEVLAKTTTWHSSLQSGHSPLSHGRNYCPISRLDLWQHFGEDDSERAVVLDDLAAGLGMGKDLLRQQGFGRSL